uniref:FMRFamide-related peptides n=1 Tax=Steinernema glaseri TaxID=37863 RepID=A0A1I8AI79_9BILA
MRAAVFVLFSLAALGTVAQQQSYDQETMVGMMKRSLALGRMGFRPGKRSTDDAMDDEMVKRSLALGRQGFRPGKRASALNFISPEEVQSALDIITEDQMGKRSMALGRAGFRPAKRSLALGRSGFRPGKRSVTIAPPTMPVNIASGRCQMDQLEEVYSVLIRLAQGFEEMSAKCNAENPLVSRK